jgi:hypothetical protein
MSRYHLIHDLKLIQHFVHYQIEDVGFLEISMREPDRNLCLYRESSSPQKRCEMILIDSLFKQPPEMILSRIRKLYHRGINSSKLVITDAPQFERSLDSHLCDTKMSDGKEGKSASHHTKATPPAGDRRAIQTKFFPSFQIEEKKAAVSRSSAYWHHRQPNAAQSIAKRMRTRESKPKNRTWTFFCPHSFVIISNGPNEPLSYRFTPRRNASKASR